MTYPLLWVREAHARAQHDDLPEFVYRADDPGTARRLLTTWTPSIHMPRRACRLVLEVVGVKEIRFYSPHAEGVSTMPAAQLAAWLVGVSHRDESRAEGFDTPTAFGEAWSKMHPAPHPWPVYRIEFRVLEVGDKVGGDERGPSAKPVLFRDDMVRAILAGTKTVTRRVGKTWARLVP